MTVTTAGPAVLQTGRLARAAFAAVVAFAVATHFSVAAGQILLTLALGLWAGHLVVTRTRPDVPRPFWPLGLYAAATLISAAASPDPAASVGDARELLLFSVVPLTFDVARGRRASSLALAIVSVGAVIALVGVVQYGVLQFDNLGRRPQGTLSHYMTYSGLLMLVIGVAAARLLYQRSERAWIALVVPVLLAALALTFTRSAWVGTCTAVGLLLLLKDLRLVALLPIAAAVFVALAPSSLSDRVYSMFDLNDPTNRDRVAMMRYGVEMIRDRPWTGVGPDQVQAVYPRYYDGQGTEPVNPHLHNVPLQIAAERGLPALAVWAWFIVGLSVDLLRRFRGRVERPAAAAALAAVVSMLSAGMFEYNFGDSEFLMIWLVIVTLPYAAARPDASEVAA
jgi:O-antigen ligase